MAIQFIHTDDAPKAIGPYSQAVRVGNLLFISGQIPIDPKSGELKLFEGDASLQAELVLSNLKAILSSEHLAVNHVVKTTIFLDNMESFAKVNDVYARFFGNHRPARACVEVSKLPKGVGVEIEAIATYPA